MSAQPTAGSPMSESGGAPVSLEERLVTLTAQVAEQQAQIDRLTTVTSSRPQEDRLSLIVFSGSLDRVLAAFILATGAAAMGTQTSIFFTFWGTAALRKPEGVARKAPLERLFGWMLPRGSEQLQLSQMNWMGMGPALIRRIMRKQGVATIDDLIQLAADLGVEIFICTMSMDLLGIKPEELREYPKIGYCGATTFLERAMPGKMTMFI